MSSFFSVVVSCVGTSRPSSCYQMWESGSETSYREVLDQGSPVTIEPQGNKSRNEYQYFSTVCYLQTKEFAVDVSSGQRFLTMEKIFVVARIQCF